jgi:heme exporter protein A
MTTPSASASAAGLLSGHRLACRRGNRRLFAGVDITLAPGTITWLRGANGSGKTSLLRLLAGLARPEAGEISRDGELIYIAHGNALKDELTLAEALAFLARLHDVAQAEQRTLHALDVMGLGARRRAFVRTLSQGQRRRGALARLALDDAPRCWLLDEPYDALDVDGIVRLSALIEANAARGGSVLYTSHQPVALAGACEFELDARRIAA